MAQKGVRDRELTGCPEDLWLIHGKLYDLKPFMNSHPGGREWLEWTQGTDCTPEYEVNKRHGGKL